MKAKLIVALVLIASPLVARADIERDIKAGLLNRTVVVRDYYVGPTLSFDESGHLISTAPRAFGPSEARIYVTDVRFEASHLIITGEQTFPDYDSKEKQFRVALLQQETKIDIALPTGQPLDQAVPALLKSVFLTTGELQQVAACPAEEQKRFEDRLTTFNEKQSHPKTQPHEKSADADSLSDVPEMCMPMGERAYMVGRGVHQPKPLKTPDPTYTEAARRARIEGTVILFLIIDAQGRPATIYVGRSLDRDLDRSAVEAVRHWTFAPANFNGTAIPVAINVEVNFRLR